MKKVVLLFIILFVSITYKQSLTKNVNNDDTKLENSKTKKEEKIEFNSSIFFKEHPEQFVHINKDCNLCMITRSAKAGCIIPKDGKILLVKDKHSDKFEIPSGKKSIKEPAYLTAVRKTFETTGYLVYIDDFISEFSSGFRLYKCKIIDEEKKENKNLELKWVDKKELAYFLKKENRKKVRFPNELDLIYGKFEWVIR